MYFPIIRGRQYDLLAIRELKRQDLLSDKIIPIIEPVKMSSTLISTIKAFTDDEREIVIISNPIVGSLLGELELPSIREKYNRIMSNDYVIIGHYFNRKSSIQIQKLIDSFNIEVADLAIIHSERNQINNYRQVIGEQVPCINIIPSDTSFKRKFTEGDLVCYDDKFNKLSRNADYLNVQNEFFTEEHLYYEDDGYYGFSDYSIVGETYSESGFAPYAVAIHIVYPNSENVLEIIHFVSDSNSDISDPAGKFSEALSKLIAWYDNYRDDHRMDTLAMRVLKGHHNSGTYPGLPTLKKLSIMHHIELVGNMLR